MSYTVGFRMWSRRFFFSLFVALVASPANAALHDRGGGLIYDDVLDVTWLQDANYAKSSGYDEDGLLNWIEAKQWASDLVYYDDVRSVMYEDWRLPSISPVNGTSFNYGWDFAGRTDTGYNITSKASEMSYMYYINLGNVSAYISEGQVNPFWGSWNRASFINLQPGNYWSGVTYDALQNRSWNFHFSWGEQFLQYQTDGEYAWAVRDGDVAAVPEPNTYALMLAGLGLVGFVARRRRGFSQSPTIEANAA